LQEIVDAVQKDIYDLALRTFRVGITPKKGHYFANGKKKLFKGYDRYVKGTVYLRRNGVTFRQARIRDWMDDFSKKIADYLESKKA
jgi:hypothetical protein